MGLGFCWWSWVYTSGIGILLVGLALYCWDLVHLKSAVLDLVGDVFLL